MVQYILVRIASMAVTILFVLVAVFTVSRLLPGSVAYSRLGETASEAQVAQLEDQLGLNDPWYQQFGEWAFNAVRLDFGDSLTVPGMKVTDEIRTRLPVTIELALLSLLVACMLGIPVGVLSALQQDGPADYILRFLAILGLALPTFWALTFLLTFSAAWFGWLPPLGYRRIIDDPIANLQQFALPSLVLGVSLSAPIMRLTRSAMLETMRADYVRTARSKGLHARTVVIRHALKNAMIPVITIIGLQMGSLLGGTVIIESVAGLPGLGRLLVDSITRRDYTMLQGAVVITATFTVAANFFVDLVYVYIDPRIRLSLSSGGPR